MKKSILTGAILAGLLSTHAFAANNRTWISGKGVDQAGCGPVATPCRTLQYAHDNTNAGGEINVLDPAGYGSVAINKAISIINDGVGTAGVLATSGNAITINAGSSDAVILRGLTIEGAKTAENGIYAQGVGSLTIANCTVQSFTNRGINDSSTFNGALRIFNTTVAGNHDGILILPLGSAVNSFDAVLDHVISTDNDSNGLQLAGDGGTSSGTFRLTVANSLLSSNRGRGASLYSGTLQINAVFTDNVFSMNPTAAFLGGSSPTVASFGRNTIAHNDTGIANFGTANTFSNNQFQNNGTDVSGGSLTPLSQK